MEGKRFSPGDVVRYKDDRAEWGMAEVVGYEAEVERLIIRFEKANMYTHSCGGAVEEHRGYWAIPGELELIREGSEKR